MQPDQVERRAGDAVGGVVGVVRVVEALGVLNRAEAGRAVRADQRVAVGHALLVRQGVGVDQLVKILVLTVEDPDRALQLIGVPLLRRCLRGRQGHGLLELTDQLRRVQRLAVQHLRVEVLRPLGRRLEHVALGLSGAGVELALAEGLHHAPGGQARAQGVAVAGVALSGADKE